MADDRTTIWATILYPESCPENFIDIFTEFHIPFFVSPLHDSDLKDDGTLKKPHYHLMFKFDTKKSRSQVQVLVDSVNGVGLEKLNSWRNYARYLCHLDEKNKIKKPMYNIHDVYFYIEDYFETIAKESDEMQLTIEILDYIDSNLVFQFVDLVSYARENNLEWFRFIVNRKTYFIKEYQKSLAFKYKV